MSSTSKRPTESAIETTEAAKEEEFEITLGLIYLFEEKKKGVDVNDVPQLQEIMKKYNNKDLIGWYTDWSQGRPLRCPGKQRKGNRRKRKKQRLAAPRNNSKEKAGKRK